MTVTLFRGPDGLLCPVCGSSRVESADPLETPERGSCVLCGLDLIDALENTRAFMEMVWSSEDPDAEEGVWWTNGLYRLEFGGNEPLWFLVWTQPKGAKFLPGARLIGEATGKQDFDARKWRRAFGFVAEASVSVWKKFRGAPGCHSAEESWAEAINAVLAEDETGEEPEGVDLVKVASLCLECNVRLGKKSRERGVGLCGRCLEGAK